MRNGISRWVLGTGLMAIVPAWAGDVLSVAAFGEVRSSYLTRGAVVNKDPAAILWTKARVNLPYGAYAGIWTWSVSAFSDSGQTAKRRYAFHENDFAPEYGYVLDIAEGWQLESTVNWKWVDLQGYEGHPEAMREWDFAQALSNPYVTPYYLMRYCVDPTYWGYWDVGVYRRCELCEDISLTPRFYCEFGDGHHFKKQYGLEGHGCGLQALNLEFRLAYALTEYLDLYASLLQFVIVDPAARGAFRHSDKVQSVTELTIFTVGVLTKF